MYIIKTGGSRKRFSFSLFYRHLFCQHLFECSATLSYYFLFSVFPLAIFISATFSTLHLSPESIGDFSGFVPQHILLILEKYLTEISLGNTPSLISFGAILTVYSMGKAIQTMKRKFRLSYGAKEKPQTFSEWVVSFLFVILIMISFYGMLFIIISGNRLFQWLSAAFPLLFSVLPSFRILRIFAVTCYLFFVLLGLYYLLPGIKQSISDVLPGTLFSLVSWVMSSYLFSFYLEEFNDYSTLYGSLGTIIALLIWLFLTNVILLLGVYVNSYFYLEKNGRTK